MKSLLSLKLISILKSYIDHYFLKDTFLLFFLSFGLLPKDILYNFVESIKAKPFILIPVYCLFFGLSIFKRNKLFDVTNIKCLDKLIEVSDLHRFFFGFFTSLIFISPLVGLLLIISCFKGILINVLYILIFSFFIAPFFSFQGLSKKNNINLSFLNSCIENIYLQKIINDNKPEIILYYLVSLIFIFSFFSLSLEDKHQFLYYFNNNIFYLTSIFLILPMVNLKRQMESEMTFVLGKIKENWIMIFVISWIIGPIFILNALIFKDLNLITMFLSVIFCYSLYIFKRDGFTYFLVMFGGSLIIMLL